jgi:hypothetical protein
VEDAVKGGVRLDGPREAKRELREGEGGWRKGWGEGNCDCWAIYAFLVDPVDYHSIVACDVNCDVHPVLGPKNERM